MHSQFLLGFSLSFDTNFQFIHFQLERSLLTLLMLLQLGSRISSDTIGMMQASGLFT